jgi:DNA-binding PadR family transcriptional regulator
MPERELHNHLRIAILGPAGDQAVVDLRACCADASQSPLLLAAGRRATSTPSPSAWSQEGFATARPEPVGRRRRTVYSITPKGRRALEHWLREPAGESRLESETSSRRCSPARLKRRTCSGHLHRLLDEARGETAAVARDLRRIPRRRRARSPNAQHFNVVCYRLIWDYTQTAASWAAWAIHEVEHGQT